MEPQELGLGSGWWVSPFTIIALCLLPLSILKRIRKIYKADMVIILFFVWSLVSLVIFPYDNVLFGVIQLGETILGYFLLRTYLSGKQLSNISYLLVSILIFQSILGSLQFLLHRPIGVLAESVIMPSPYGFATIENPELFRVSGTFYHPNFFAAFLLFAIPFLLLFPVNNLLIKIFKIISPIILFFTYSRAAWIIFVVIVILMFITKLIRFKIPESVPLWWYSIPIAFTVIFIILTPYLNTRINSLPQAFEDGGSFDIRMKLINEGVNLIEQYPITGIGLNRSLEVYASDPITNIFNFVRPSAQYKIHNMFVEIATETGIPGLLFFVMFLSFVFKNYFKNKKTYLKNAAFFGLLGLIGISMFNPFFHTSQFRIFFLLSAIILV